jgi:chromosome partitioning protein
MLDKRRTTSKQILEKAGERFKDRVFNATIPKNSPLSDAPSFGMPICLYDPKCPGAIAYEELTTEVLQW